MPEILMFMIGLSHVVAYIGLNTGYEYFSPKKGVADWIAGFLRAAKGGDDPAQTSAR
jgi:hypothetical protein